MCISCVATRMGAAGRPHGALPDLLVTLAYSYLQGIAAAAENADLVSCRSTLVPLIGDLLVDKEPEIKLAALQQAALLGKRRPRPATWRLGLPP